MISVGLNTEDLNRAKTEVDLVALVEQYISLRKRGTNLTGLCPFHAEKTPSFNVNLNTRWLKCFGCGWSGDVISFVQEIEHLDFPDAARRVAELARVELRDDDPAAGRRRSARRDATNALEAAVALFCRTLDTADGQRAIDYLRTERGFTNATLARFRVGYAPRSGVDEIAKEIGDDALLAAGLIGTSDGRRWNSFYNRIMFPIGDASGATVGFSARAMPGADSPAKYKNTAETSLFAKSRSLFGIDVAKADIVRLDEVVVCEGQTDVMAMFQAGIPNAVAACGTAFGADHLAVLRRFTRRVVLAFDADGAGAEAVRRLWSLERESGVDLFAAALPPGTDPGDFITSPAELVAMIAAAKPITEHVIDAVLDRAGPTPEDVSRTVNDAVALLVEHPDSIVRAQYVHLIADRFRIDPNAVSDRLAKAERRARRGSASAVRDPQPTQPISEAPTVPIPAIELEMLRWIVNHPQHTWGDASVLDWTLPRLFTHPVASATLRAVLDADGDQSRLSVADHPVLDELRSTGPSSDAGDTLEALWRALAKRRLSACPDAATRSATYDALDQIDSDPASGLRALYELHGGDTAAEPTLTALS